MVVQDLAWTSRIACALGPPPYERNMPIVAPSLGHLMASIKGPKFLKIGARVLYREEDVEAFEASQVCQNTSGPLPVEGV